MFWTFRDYCSQARVQRRDSRVQGSASERSENGLNGVQDVRTEHGSRQGQNLALAVLFVPCSLDSGRVSCFKSRVQSSRFRGSGSGFQVRVLPRCPIWSWVPRLGLRGPGFKFRFSSFGFQISGFKFRVSSGGFHVSGFKFRVAGTSMSARTRTESDPNDPDSAENSVGGAGPPGSAGPSLVGKRESLPFAGHAPHGGQHAEPSGQDHVVRPANDPDTAANSVGGAGPPGSAGPLLVAGEIPKSSEPYKQYISLLHTTRPNRKLLKTAWMAPARLVARGVSSGRRNVPKTGQKRSLRVRPLGSAGPLLVGRPESLPHGMLPNTGRKQRGGRGAAFVGFWGQDSGLRDFGLGGNSEGRLRTQLMPLSHTIRPMQIAPKTAWGAPGHLRRRWLEKLTSLAQNVNFSRESPGCEAEVD